MDRVGHKMTTKDAAGATQRFVYAVGDPSRPNASDPTEFSPSAPPPCVPSPRFWWPDPSPEPGIPSSCYPNISDRCSAARTRMTRCRPGLRSAGGRGSSSLRSADRCIASTISRTDLNRTILHVLLLVIFIYFLFYIIHSVLLHIIDYSCKIDKGK